MKTIDRPYLCFALICIVLLFSGCAVTAYRDPQVKFIRITFGTDQQIGPIDMKSKESQVKIGGVKSEQSTAAGTVTNAAVKALKPQILP